MQPWLDFQFDYSAQRKIDTIRYVHLGLGLLELVCAGKVILTFPAKFEKKDFSNAKNDSFYEVVAIV